MRRIATEIFMNFPSAKTKNMLLFHMMAWNVLIGWIVTIYLITHAMATTGSLRAVKVLMCLR